MRVLWTFAAADDRESIFRYIARDNLTAAIRIDRDFDDAEAKLSRFPHIGKLGAIEGTRELLVRRNYRVVYEIGGASINILGVIHTARKWPPDDETP